MNHLCPSVGEDLSTLGHLHLGEQEYYTTIYENEDPNTLTQKDVYHVYEILLN